MLALKNTFFMFTEIKLKFMINKDQDNKGLTEHDQTDNDVIQKIIDKRTLLEEKFNQVNERLDQLKAEADKLLHPKKS